MAKKIALDDDFRPMKVQVRRGSTADKYYSARALADGIAPSPDNDLIFHGGKTVPNMQFQNLYLGGNQSWQESDIVSIDKAITTAMQDRRLNNVMAQYFLGKTISCTARASQILPGTQPATVSQGDAEALITKLFRDGQLGSDLGSTIFNFVLPSGTVLNMDAAPTGSLVAARRAKKAVAIRRTASSLNGLGGYHGSVHVKNAQGKNVTLYYSTNVFSEVQPNGRANGIVAFNEPWKNVVGTLYHELNEFRTDPDVDDAIDGGNNPAFLGWTSRHGEEIGDFPIAVANPLAQVFQEVKAASKKFLLPIQFQYSNAVHGPEGPRSRPYK